MAMLSLKKFVNSIACHLDFHVPIIPLKMENLKEKIVL